jgi:hypothetical protein
MFLISRILRRGVLQLRSTIVGGVLIDLAIRALLRNETFYQAAASKYSRGEQASSARHSRRILSASRLPASKAPLTVEFKYSQKDSSTLTLITSPSAPFSSVFINRLTFSAVMLAFDSKRCLFSWRSATLGGSTLYKSEVLC